MARIPKERIWEYVRTALLVLMDNDDSLRSREVVQQVGQRLSLNEYELERHQISGQIRWETILHFYSVSAVKAGWVIKNKGIWYITPEGKDVTVLSNKEYFDLSEAKYKDWYNNQRQKETTTEQVEDVEEIPSSPELTFEKASNDANSEIEDFVRRRGPY